MPLSGSESDNMLRYLQITYADSDRNTASNNDPSALIAYNRSGEIRTPWNWQKISLYPDSDN